MRRSVRHVVALVLAGAGVAACRTAPDADSVAAGSAASIDSTFAVGGRLVRPALLNEYVARRLGFTSRGGEMRCAYTPLGTSGDRVFVNMLCLELVRDGDTLAVGSGRGGPVAVRIGSDGDSVRVLSHEAPADGGGHAASIRRIFPPDIAARIFAPAAAHNVLAGRLEYYLRGEAALRLGLRPPSAAPDISRTK